MLRRLADTRIVRSLTGTIQPTSQAFPPKKHRKPSAPLIVRLRSAVRMQTPVRIFVVALVALTYIFVTFHLMGVQQQCPDVEQMILKKENARLLESIQRIAGSVNAAAILRDPQLQDDFQGPLAKLGVKIPSALNEPPTAPAAAGDGAVTPKPTQFANEKLAPHRILDPNFAPNTVYYVWCGRRWFEFHHYLSVKSVIRELWPDNIIFYYDNYPIIDSWTYNTWFDELKSEYPFFRPRQLGKDEQACDEHGKPDLKFIFTRLTNRGGLYITEHTMLAKFPPKFRNYSLVHALDVEKRQGLLMSKPGLPGNRDLSLIVDDPAHYTRTFECTSIEKFVKAHRKPLCVLTKNVFYPKDIWNLDNSFGKLARRIFYGTPEIRAPKPSYEELIPNIAHIVWLGGGEMDFLFYLGVLSLIYVAEVDVVYIHGDGPPSGALWERIRHHEKVKLIYRETPKTVYGNTVNVISHVTDVWRVDFMVKYGGIYVDTDTVFVKPLDRRIRGYDAVGSYDWTYWNHPFPDTINFGVAIGKRNAPYWVQFQETMKWFMDNDWSWNGLRQPYRIKERHPESVLIDPHLQIICFQSKCHPTWWPNYHEEKIDHLNSNSIKDWLNDTYAFHWTLPTPYELLTEENLMKTNTMFSQIGKYVLQKAGLLKPGKS